MNAPESIEDLQPFGDDYGPLLTGAFAPVFDETDADRPPLVKGAIPTGPERRVHAHRPEPALRAATAATTRSTATAWCTPRCSTAAA